MTGMKAVEVVDVAVLVFGIIDVGAPFQQLAVTPHLVRNDIVQHMLPLPHFGLVHFQRLGRVDGA